MVQTAISLLLTLGKRRLAKSNHFQWKEPIFSHFGGGGGWVKSKKGHQKEAKVKEAQKANYFLGIGHLRGDFSGCDGHDCSKCGQKKSLTRDLAPKAKVLRCPTTTMHDRISWGWHISWGGTSVEGDTSVGV